MRRLIVCIGVGMIAAVALWLFWQKTHADASQQISAIDASAATQFTNAQLSAPAERQPSAGSHEYHSGAYHFSLFYPAELSGREYPKDGQDTIIFEDSTGEKGFQIFILPYPLDHVDAARFHDDIPSGVIQGKTDIMIDGVRATMFFSTNELMGDTREVWIIHGGFLYEITTYKDLDTWLAGIMQTWKFTK